MTLIRRILLHFLLLIGEGSPLASIIRGFARQIIYHQYFEDFLKIDIQAKIDRTNALITNYVASHDDPISFCSHEEYLLAVNALRDFCRLRTLSIRGQLDGTIPSTHTGQMEANETLIDSSKLRLSVMGTSVTR